jgi:hypothetical protein
VILQLVEQNHRQHDSSLTHPLSTPALVMAGNLGWPPALGEKNPSRIGRIRGGRRRGGGNLGWPLAQGEEGASRIWRIRGGGAGGVAGKERAAAEGTWPERGGAAAAVARGGRRRGGATNPAAGARRGRSGRRPHNLRSPVRSSSSTMGIVRAQEV